MNEEGKHVKSRLRGIISIGHERPFLFYLKKRYSRYSEVFKIFPRETSVEELEGK
jgi:hypothetical protein